MTLDYATAAELARLFGLGLFASLFAAIAVWLFRPGRRAAFRDHARIPFDGEERAE